MKKIFFPLVLAASVEFSAFAATLYEPFNYDLSVTNLIGQTSPDDITWTQAGPDAGLDNQPTIFEGSLSAPGLSPSSGNSIQLGGNGASARYSFADAVNSGTLYYSFLFKITDIGGLSATGVFWAGLNNSVGSQKTTPTVVQARVVTKSVTVDGTNAFQIGLDKSSGQVGQFVFATNVFFTNETIFVVVGYTYNSVEDTADDQAAMWINPDPSAFGSDTPPTPTLTSIAGKDATTIHSFVFFNRSAAEPGEIIADELLISTNWADVTPLATTMNITTQPRSQTVVPGVDTYLEVAAYRAQTYQWQRNEVDLTGETNRFLFLNNIQAANAGEYRAITSNPFVSKTSIVATVIVTNGNFPVLSEMWSIAPESRPYVTINTSGTPFQQSIAYNALSNQVIITSRTNNDASGVTINVLDADTGEFLYNMDTSALASGGISPLMMMAVADDGSVYGANATGNGTVTSYLLYRWADSGSNTVAVNVFNTGDPAYQSAAFRWGDTMSVRGTGLETEILIDSSTVWAAVLKPTDESLSLFQNYPFPNNYSDGSIGRSVQFGTGDTLWQKRKGERLQISSYTLVDFNIGESTPIADNNNFPGNVGPVGFNLETNLLAGIGFALSNSTPDTVNFYDISDFNNPVLLGKYPFPTNQQGNVNFFGQVLVTTNRVFAIDGNNGVVALAITNAPPPAPELTATISGGQITISWPTSVTDYTLQFTPSLAPANWQNVTTPTNAFNSVTESAGSGMKFYRLFK